jgi:hypothetical protein
MKSLCDKKTEIFAKKCVGRGGLELPISRLLDQTVTTRPLPLFKTDGQYTYIQWCWSHNIYQKVYGQGGVDAMALRLQDKRASILPTHLLVVWWWKPAHLLMRDNMEKNK